jgi:uncharacterized protein UPF0160
MNGGFAPERPEEATMPAPRRPLLVTHPGTFHLDGAFAYAGLRLALGPGAAGEDHALVRTRDEAAIAAADVARDVGAVYDAAARRFDHHQRGTPVRDGGGLPHSAAGPVWRRRDIGRRRRRRGTGLELGGAGGAFEDGSGSRPLPFPPLRPLRRAGGV